jgi:transcription elongation GreA/GreB family factor
MREIIDNFRKLFHLIMRTKADILQVLQKKLQSSLEEAERDYLLAKESRDSDTKSSAGDKFETGREMMQREMDKLSTSIDLLKSQLNKIASIDVSKSSAKVGFGTYLITDAGHYFMSIGLGKISDEFGDFFAISSDSPIGALLMGKQIGESIELNKRKINLISML